MMMMRRRRSKELREYVGMKPSLSPIHRSFSHS